MNMENIPTPETDALCERIGDPAYATNPRTDKCRDLERRLAVAREAIKAMIADLRLRGELCEDGVVELNISNGVLLQAEEALTLTARKP